MLPEPEVEGHDEPADEVAIPTEDPLKLYVRQMGSGRLLTGDTLFWGGAGNCKHGGDPALLADSFSSVVARLDGALEVNPGHDYAEANLPFALELEPSNARARAQLDAARAARARGEEPRPTTLDTSQ